MIIYLQKVFISINHNTMNPNQQQQQQQPQQQSQSQPNNADQTPSKESVKQAILSMKTESTNNQSSSTTVQNMKAGTGFQTITGTSQQEYQIIKAQYAAQEFADIVKVLKKIAPLHTEHINQVQRKFNRRIVYDFCSKNFPIRKDNARQLTILRIEYINKKDYSYIGYDVFNLTFTLSPDLFLKTYSSSSSSSNSSSFGIQMPGIGGLNFSSSSSNSNSKSYQQIQQKQRGLNSEDLQALLTISNLGGSNREKYLDMIDKYD